MGKTVLQIFWLALAFFLITGCDKSDQEESSEPLFTLLTPEETGIDFVNVLDYDENFNIYTYRNYYNGGGVGLGDFNNDDLIDIYMISNTDSNRLFLNKGDFRFEDITASSGTAGTHSWSTGVSIADVNGDGLLDIYVANSGEVEGDDKQNELFINNGDLTFREAASEFGLDDRGYTTHASFFDYDRDGDLDVYMLNNSFKAIGSFDLSEDVRSIRHPVGGDRLYRNDDGKFVDVSEEAGIYGSIIGFGLGVTVGDINNDGWQDLYISNDFFERDYIYMNNRDGTFSEVLEQQMRSISGASMGADMADINNDGYMDIFVTEMLPRDEGRVKMVTTFESWERYQENVSLGYYHQFTRNMLHLNNANGTFSEIGRLAEVYATDWSWGALMADFDNDGLKDLFVSNGIYQDLTNQDYLMKISDKSVQRSIISQEGVDYKMLIDAIPSERISNYAFRNNGDLTFDDATVDWGLEEPSHSNGSAYGDLDNDGDLDLVINNVNMSMFIYRNNADKRSAANYLKLKLNGSAQNTFAVGTRVEVLAGDETFTNELVPVRGFESTMDHRMLIAVGAHEQIDRVTVTWPDGKTTIIDSARVNSTLVVDHKDAVLPPAIAIDPPKPLLQQVEVAGLDVEHEENTYVDFHRDKLLFHMRSSEGPKISVGDVNNDQLDDLFIGASKGNTAQLFVSGGVGYELRSSQVFEMDANSEDLGSAFFDADGDGDLDLYVCSGSSEFSNSATALNDRLYLNDGKGNYTKQDAILPAGRFESTSVVRPHDFDGDGDIDLFVGVRLRPFLYGVPGNGYLLENDGTGKFSNITGQIAPDLNSLGMITDADWADMDGDGDSDLVIVGEWMAPQLFVNKNGIFEKSSVTGITEYLGWWNTLLIKDLNGDDLPEMILGNHGLNSRFKASMDKPITLYVNDFNGNGSAEQIFTQFNGDTAFPVALRHDVLAEIPQLKEKYPTYEDYKGQTVQDMFPPELLQNSVVQKVTYLASAIAWNRGSGTFEMKALPLEVQLSPVYAIYADDLDADGHQDLLLGGNLYRSKPEVGRYDASYGSCLLGDGQGGFTTIKPEHTGIFLNGEVRDIAKISTKEGEKIVVSRNNDKAVLLQKTP